MIDFTLFIINIYIILNLNLKINKEIKKILIDKSIFITNMNKLLYSIIIIIMYFLVFIFLFRIVRIFYNTQKIKYLDINEITKIFAHINIDNVYNYTIIIIILISFFFNLKKLIFGSVRFHYLRIHYYYLLRVLFYRNIFYSLKNYSSFISDKTRISLDKILFIKTFFFKLSILVYFVVIIFFKIKLVYIGFLPWYGLYYFIISVLDFTARFKEDFDMGMMQCYYPDNFCVTKQGKDKLKLYQILLLLGIAELKFEFQFENNLLNSYVYQSEFNQKILNFNFYKIYDFCYFTEFTNVFIMSKDTKPTYVNDIFDSYFFFENLKYNDYIDIIDNNYSFI
ncbi:MAG: hypothetical protein EOP33_06415 [Rickettsiaceae bacterium]|nr:MAG: hypothetical protein EOP33_06415 [Rickettsiaceae bacterium]